MLLEKLLVFSNCIPHKTDSRTVLWESLLCEGVAKVVREDKTATFSFINYLPLTMQNKF